MLTYLACGMETVEGTEAISGARAQAVQVTPLTCFHVEIVFGGLVKGITLENQRQKISQKR